MLQLANCNHGVKNKARESRTTPWVLAGGGLCLEGKHICDPWLAILHPFTFFHIPPQGIVLYGIIHMLGKVNSHPAHALLLIMCVEKGGQSLHFYLNPG